MLYRVLLKCVCVHIKDNTVNLRRLNVGWAENFLEAWNKIKLLNSPCFFLRNTLISPWETIFGCVKVNIQYLYMWNTSGLHHMNQTRFVLTCCTFHEGKLKIVYRRDWISTVCACKELATCSSDPKYTCTLYTTMFSLFCLDEHLQEHGELFPMHTLCT